MGPLYSRWFSLLLGILLGACSAQPFADTGTQSQGQISYLTTCGNLGDSLGYAQEQLRCVRKFEQAPNACDPDWEDPEWTCDVFTQEKIPLIAIPGNDPRNAPQLVENTDWRILNLVGTNLQPTVLGDAEECALCLGYSPEGHPQTRDSIEPETSMDGLWRSSLDPNTGNSEFYFRTPFLRIETKHALTKIYACIALDASKTGPTLADVTPSKLDCSSTPLYEGVIEQRNGQVGIKLGDVRLLRDEESMTIAGTAVGVIGTRFQDVTYDKLRIEGIWQWSVFLQYDNTVITASTGVYEAKRDAAGSVIFEVRSCNDCPGLKLAEANFDGEQIFEYTIALDYDRPVTMTDGNISLVFRGLDASLAPTLNGWGNFCQTIPANKGALYICFSPVVHDLTPSLEDDVQA